MKSPCDPELSRHSRRCMELPRQSRISMLSQLWTEFLPNSEISFVEFNAVCAEKYRDTIEREGRGRLYVGDQANVTFLNSIVDDQGEKVFDVIVDDGTRVRCLGRS